MIILAAAVVIALDNSGVINKANEAVDSSNIKQVQHLASLIWADAYLDEDMEKEDITADYIIEELADQGVSTDAYSVIVEENGVTVTKKLPTIGSLVTSAADYGKTVNYVSDSGRTDWKVFYHTDKYVYLITSSLNETQNMWQSNTETIQNPTIWMAEWGDYTNHTNIVNMLNEDRWTALKNTTASYKDYVIGAIGAPTSEMFAASWNAKRQVAIANGDTTTYNMDVALTKETDGYSSNIHPRSRTLNTADELYFVSLPVQNSMFRYGYYLASPNGSFEGGNSLRVLDGGIGGYDISQSDWTYRPVVCLSIDCPAQVGTTTDIAI